MAENGPKNGPGYKPEAERQAELRAAYQKRPEWSPEFQETATEQPDGTIRTSTGMVYQSWPAYVAAAVFQQTRARRFKEATRGIADLLRDGLPHTEYPPDLVSAAIAYNAKRDAEEVAGLRAAGATLPRPDVVRRLVEWFLAYHPGPVEKRIMRAKVQTGRIGYTWWERETIKQERLGKPPAFDYTDEEALDAQTVYLLILAWRNVAPHIIHEARSLEIARSYGAREAYFMEKAQGYQAIVTGGIMLAMFPVLAMFAGFAPIVAATTGLTTGQAYFLTVFVGMRAFSGLSRKVEMWQRGGLGATVEVGETLTLGKPGALILAAPEAAVTEPEKKAEAFNELITLMRDVVFSLNFGHAINLAILAADLTVVPHRTPEDYERTPPRE